MCIPLGRLLGDLAAVDEFFQVAVHGDAALAALGFHLAGDLGPLATADQVREGGVVDHHLHRCPSSLAVFSGHQLLGDDHRQAEGELRTDFAGTFSGEEIDEAGDGTTGILGVQGGDHHMTGFGGGQGEGGGFRVAHLTDEDHIRILPQGTAQSSTERCQVLAQFPL